MAAMSKNVYFDMINDFVDKYNNTYHRVIKMKPIDVKCSSHAILLLIGLTRFLCLVKSKIPYHEHTLLVISTVKKLMESSIKKNCGR